MAAEQRLVTYKRISTVRQGASGLGLEAQRKVIEDFAASRGAEVLPRFMEVESGRRADRPELAKALHLAKVTGSRATPRSCWCFETVLRGSSQWTCSRRTT